MPERLVHIHWQGPFSLESISSLSNWPDDCGLYQIYAHHPVYGAGQLVYIGKAVGQTFSVRIPQHGWGSGSENDRRNVAVYVGRLHSETPLKKIDWEISIALAEMLLIHAHGPAYNSTHIMSINESIYPEVREARILNWGDVRALQREVSGLMWTSAAAQFDGFAQYVGGSQE